MALLGRRYGRTIHRLCPRAPGPATPIIGSPRSHTGADNAASTSGCSVCLGDGPSALAAAVSVAARVCSPSRARIAIRLVRYQRLKTLRTGLVPARLSWG
ncbi:hypothetical protein Sviol_50940 [Streptomyces violascens]|uniref:Uncharacterized protein n=1 Tax=Streptomyces violascens TaxID=67381 RepID=A0ABQ3QTT3_9ACTN|nr:hypothetical protein Sviol_50940 [Streptomyces violascens]